MNEQTAERQRLAERLRSMRETAGISTTRLAQLLDWSQSKVSKAERGRSLPTPDDVGLWARTLGADPALTDEVIALAAAAATQLTEWRRDTAVGRRRMQDDIRRMEQAASVIRVFGHDVVPGLVQTRPYVEAMLRLGKRALSPTDLADLVEKRLRRQDVLLDGGTARCVLLLCESAVRRHLLPADQMREQIEHLIAVARSPQVDVELIPFTADERVHSYHGFAIIGDPGHDDEAIVLAETVTRGLRIRSPEEVTDYLEHFAELRVAAIAGDRLVGHLRRIAESLV